MPPAKGKPKQKAVVAAPLSLKPKDPAPVPSGFPWERLPNESHQAYSQFVRYRSTPLAERSYRKLGVAHSLACRWAARYKWRLRTEAYDDYLATLRDDVSEAASLRARAKAVRFADRAMDKATLGVEQLNTAKLDSGSVIGLAKAASDIGRLALGISETRPGLTVNAQGGQVGVLWGGESPAWLQAGKPNETKTERSLNETANGPRKVLANDTQPATDVHAPEDVIEVNPTVAPPLSKKIKD